MKGRHICVGLLTYTYIALLAMAWFLYDTPVFFKACKHLAVSALVTTPLIAFFWVQEVLQEKAARQKRNN